MNNAEWMSKLDDKSLKVGIVGLGYVGLPLAMTFARAGFTVLGFDIDAQKTDRLNKGEGYLKHLELNDLKVLVTEGRIEATTDFSLAAECGAVILCVPTPLTKHREPDTSYIESTAKSLAPHLSTGTLVALESTTYPGTTDELLLPLLEQGSGLSLQKGELKVAYSPEREDPGNAKHNTKTIPKVVGGVDGTSQEAATALYAAALDEIVSVRSAREAEMTKLLENIFRAVNIALVNELKVLGHRMGVDIWDVINAAATKPFGYMPFFPGPGLGGHCIPIDPFYLTWKAREFGMNTRFIELAGEINTAMPAYVVERTAEALNKQGKAVNGAKILLLGVAYKKNVDDVRESPAFEILELLQERQAEVSYHDPHVPVIPETRRGVDRLESVPLNAQMLGTFDVVVVVTDHDQVDYSFVADHAHLVVDTRHAAPPRGNVYQA